MKIMLFGILLIVLSCSNFSTDQINIENFICAEFADSSVVLIPKDLSFKNTEIKMNWNEYPTYVDSNGVYLSLSKGVFNQLDTLDLLVESQQNALKAIYKGLNFTSSNIVHTDTSINVSYRTKRSFSGETSSLALGSYFLFTDLNKGSYIKFSFSVFRTTDRDSLNLEAIIEEKMRNTIDSYFYFNKENRVR